MTEQGKKVWKELENMGWSGKLENMHLEYFEDIIEATKKVLNIPNVSQQREQLIALIKYYENKPLTIGLEEPELLVDKFLAINCG